MKHIIEKNRALKAAVAERLQIEKKNNLSWMDIFSILCKRFNGPKRALNRELIIAQYLHPETELSSDEWKKLKTLPNWKVAEELLDDVQNIDPDCSKWTKEGKGAYLVRNPGYCFCIFILVDHLDAPCEVLIDEFNFEVYYLISSFEDIKKIYPDLEEKDFQIMH